MKGRASPETVIVGRDAYQPVVKVGPAVDVPSGTRPSLDRNPWHVEDDKCHVPMVSNWPLLDFRAAMESCTTPLASKCASPSSRVANHHEE